jgi:hypothetical protein
MDLIVGTTAREAASRAQKAAMEGPTYRQALAMAQRRNDLLGQAREAYEAGDTDRGVDLDFEAWGVEDDLRGYGFHVDTGKPDRAAPAPHLHPLTDPPRILRKKIAKNP